MALGSTLSLFFCEGMEGQWAGANLLSRTSDKRGWPALLFFVLGLDPESNLQAKQNHATNSQTIVPILQSSQPGTETNVGQPHRVLRKDSAGKRERVDRLALFGGCATSNSVPGRQDRKPKIGKEKVYTTVETLFFLYLSGNP